MSDPKHAKCGPDTVTYSPDLVIFTETIKLGTNNFLNLMRNGYSAKYGHLLAKAVACHWELICISERIVST